MKNCDNCGHREKDGYGCYRVLACIHDGHKYWVEDTSIQVYANAAKKSVDHAARQGAQKIIKRNQAEELIKADTDDFWAWWGKTSPPDWREKEPLPPGEPKKKGGGSKSKGRKKKPKKSEFTRKFLDL